MSLSKRATQKQALEAFERLMRSLGKTRATPDTPIAGIWFLDTYGQQCIIRQMEPNRAISEPFGSRYYTLAEFCSHANFAAAAIGVSILSSPGSYWTGTAEATRKVVESR